MEKLAESVFIGFIAMVAMSLIMLCIAIGFIFSKALGIAMVLFAAMGIGRLIREAIGIE